jgi:hypothetical protein
MGGVAPKRKGPTEGVSVHESQSTTEGVLLRFEVATGPRDPSGPLLAPKSVRPRGEELQGR